ncbi:MAG TPA: hypothetical protein VF254_07940 [Gammaproteobacteria bacterium]
MSESNEEVGQRIQEKFQFYLLGLTFTLLGLSVQTANFGESFVAGILELSAWTLLFISALAQAYNLERAPHIYKLFDVHNNVKQDQKEFQDLKMKGTSSVTVRQTREIMDIDEVIRNVTTKVSAVDAAVKSLEEKIHISYRIHRYGFVVGVAMLLLARAWIPAQEIFLYLLRG